VSGHGLLFVDCRLKFFTPHALNGCVLTAVLLYSETVRHGMGGIERDTLIHRFYVAMRTMKVDLLYAVHIRWCCRPCAPYVGRVPTKLEQAHRPEGSRLSDLHLVCADNLTSKRSGAVALQL
jgi:hypothetical protein